jgi:hypothetical protein
MIQKKQNLSIVPNISTLVGLFLAIMGMGTGQTLQAGEEDTLRMTFTTTSAGGNHGPKNVHAIYLTTPSGQFITTVGNGATAKRALWGDKRAHEIRQWFTSNPNTNADIDARTGATERSYKTYTIQWNCTKRDGTVVPDGTYLLKFEMTDANYDKNKFNRAQFTITKARQAWTTGPVSRGGYDDVRLEYTPGKPQPIEIEVSPTVLNFGRVPVGQGKDMSVTILNKDNAPLPIATLSITGEYASMFELISPPVLPFEVPITGRNIGQVILTLRFSADQPGGFEGTSLHIANESILASAEVPLKAEAFMASSSIRVTPEAIDFNAVPIHETASQVLKLFNDGLGLLQIDNISIAGSDAEAFAILQAPTLPFEILPQGDPIAMTIGYTPLTHQAYGHSALAITSNDPNQPVLSVGLSGESSALTAPKLELSSTYPGPCSAMTVAQDQQILLGCGATLCQVSLSEPDRIKKQLRLPGRIEAITTENNQAFVALGTMGLSLVDLDIWESQIPVDTPGSCRAVASTPSFLYAVTVPEGLLVYDLRQDSSGLSDPQAYALGQAMSDLLIHNNVLLALDDHQGLMLLDILEPTPTLLGQVPEAHSGQALSVWKNTVYVANRLGEILVIDTTNLATPTLETRIQVNQTVTSLFAAQHTLFAGLESGDIMQFDLSVPIQPKWCHTTTTQSAIQAIEYDTHLLVADYLHSLNIWDISLPCDPQKQATEILTLRPFDVSLSNNQAWVAGGIGGLVQIELSQGQEPHIVQALPLNPDHDDCRALAISDNLAFVANGQAGIYRLDLSQTPASLITGHYQTQLFALDVDCNANILVACDSNTVYSLDPYDADLSTVLGTWDANGWALQVAINNQRAYVANGEKGLVILNLPTATFDVQIDTPGQVYDVDVDDTRLCLADGNGGIRIYSRSQDTDWSHAATLVTPGTARRVRLQGQTLSVTGDFGVWLVDISTPSQPVLMAQSTLPVKALGTAQQGKNIIVADPDGGLLILDIP